METSCYGNILLWKHLVMETSCYGNILLWKHLVMETSCYGNILLWKHLVHFCSFEDRIWHMKYFLTYYMVGCEKNWKKSACRSSKFQGAQWSGGCPRCPGNDLQKKIRVEHAFLDSQP